MKVNELADILKIYPEDMRSRLPESSHDKYLANEKLCAR